jgi:hypothetical protein
MSTTTDKAWELLCRATPARVLKSFLGFLLRHPQLTDRLEFHVRKIHFYEPLPDFSAITAEALTRRRQSKAIAWNVSAQQEWAANLAGFATELAALREKGTDNGGFDFANLAFSPLDAAVYYATVREVKPRRIIEIGAGHSTRIACMALQKNRTENHPGQMS